HLLDIRSPKLFNLVKKIKPEFICQLAGINVISKAAANPAEDVSIAVAGTVNLLQAVKDLKIKKFLYVSSCAVYGESRLPAKENTVINPSIFYSLSRATAESYVNFYAQNFGLPTVVVRLTNVYGPRQTAGTIPRWLRSLDKNEPLILEGKGEQIRDYLYVTDAANGLISALQKLQGVYNLSTGEAISMREIVLALGQVIGQIPKVDYCPIPAGEIINRVFDSSALARDTGWQPQVPLLDGLRLTLKWWKEKVK
ncbi:MAG: NAD-dependent epimerase/dehydratase family protein, partial [Patescibacteria group bacterium]